MVILRKPLDLVAAIILLIYTPSSLLAVTAYTSTPTASPTAVVKVQPASNANGFESVTLEGRLANARLQYKYNQADSRAGGKDTISIIFEVPILAWAGWAMSNNGGFMVGSEAVIGIPDTGEVLKYKMDSRSLAGVQPMAQEKQTLIDTSIRQEDDKTILSFTKILVELDEIPIDISNDNIFLAAWGFDNSLNFHAEYGSFLLSGQVLETRKQTLWKAHGWLAAIAWGVLSPLAIACSVLRRFIPGNDLWFQCHRILNILVVAFTIAAFAIAVAAINQETPQGAEKSHFDGKLSNGHRKLGLVIFIVALLQAIGGSLRPHLPSSDEEKGPIEVLPEMKSYVRVGWEIFHKVFGLSILGLCLYQVQLGIKTYGTLFSASNADGILAAFWTVAGTLVAIILGGYVLRLVALQKQDG